MRAAYIVILFACWTSMVRAQSVPLLKELALEHYQNERYLDAIEFYEKIVGLDQQDLISRYNLADCYYKTFQYELAVEQLQVISDSDNQELASQALYYFGSVLKLDEDYLAADSVFAHLIKSYQVDDELLLQARKQRAGVKLALDHKASNRRFTIAELDELNSTDFHDFGAVVNPNENMMVFVSTRRASGQQQLGTQFAGLLPDLLQYRNHNGRWSGAQGRNNFNKLNSQWAEGSGSFTKDGSAFYFTSCRANEGSDCLIMASYREDDQWTEPVPLNDYINEEGTENKQPNITHGGDTLFFVSNREGGLGGSDIWMSLKGFARGTWTPAINLGEVINTQFDEITPYYSSAFSCLIFSSSGHVGYGGFDIFAAKGESFFEPELYNLGDPFNSPHDDTYFSIHDSIGYLSTNRNDHVLLNNYTFSVNDEALYLSLLISGESLIDSRIVSKYKQVRTLDLTTFRIEDYQGFELFDPVKRNKPAPSLLANSPFQSTEENSSTTDNTSVTQATATNYTSPPNQKNADINISETDNTPILESSANALTNEMAEASNSPIVSETEDTSITQPASTGYQNQSIENQYTAIDIKGKDQSGVRTLFEKLYFELNRPILTPDDKISLDELVAQLKVQEYSSVDVYIYTDKLGSSQYNFQLSDERGQNIRSYLSSAGIESSKLNIYPMGENGLLTDGDSWYDHIFNRRAEIYVNSEKQIKLVNAQKYLLRRDMGIDEACQRLSVSKDQLQEWNPDIGNIIPSGSFLRIENATLPSPDLHYFIEEKDIRYDFFSYVIKEGETLSSLARKFRIPEELIQELNHIEKQPKTGEEIFLYRLNF